MFELIKGIVYWKEECSMCDGKTYNGDEAECRKCNGNGHLLEEVKPEKPHDREQGYYVLNRYKLQLSLYKKIEEALKVNDKSKKIAQTAIKNGKGIKNKDWSKFKAAHKLLSSLYWDGENIKTVE